jgi:hypothetical protein
LAAAIVTKLEFALVPPLAGDAQVPGLLRFGRASPM